MKRASLPLDGNRAKRVLNNFVLNEDDLVRLENIGSGGYGDVYVGRYRPTGEKVAIKELRVREVTENDLLQYQREIQIHAVTSHRFFVPFIGYTNKQPYCIVTRYMENGSLYSALHGGTVTLDPLEKTKIAFGVALGMHYLHEKGLVHRDLKTPNVLLDDDKLPKICDFGLSRVITYDNMTRAIGTPQWMAPEIIKGGVYDEKVDVYSYGVILWEMLTEEIPFEGKTTFQILYDMNMEVNPFQLPDGAGGQFVDLIQSCLSLDPIERPAFRDIVRMYEGGMVFPGCECDDVAGLFRSGPLQPEVPIPFARGKAATPPLGVRIQPRKGISKHRSVGTFLVADVRAQLLKLKERDDVGINEALSFFENTTDYAAVALVPIWNALLSFLFQTITYEDRITAIIMKFARNDAILRTITQVRHLERYLHSKTLDLFLHVLDVVPSCFDAECMSKLKLFTLRQGSIECHKSILLLLKMYNVTQDETTQKELVEFFLFIIQNFKDEAPGRYLVELLFLRWVNEDPLVDDNTIKPLVSQFMQSNNEANIAGAYYCILSTNRVNEFVTKDMLLSHMERSMDLCDCVCDVLVKDLSRFLSREVVVALIQAYLKFGVEKACLLLCKIAEANPQGMLDLSPSWLLAKEHKSLGSFKILIIIAKALNALDQLCANPLVIDLLLEVLKTGSSEGFTCVCWFLLSLSSISDLWQVLENSGLLHQLAQCLKSTTGTAPVKFAAKLVRKVARIGYSTSYSVVVQVLIDHLNESQDAARECLTALAQLVQYNQLKRVFTLFHAEEVIDKYRSRTDLEEVVQFIRVYLKAGSYDDKFL